MNSGKYYDFHIHTNFSDGKLSPGDVVRLALDNDLNTIAITDHYSLAGVDYARAVLKKMTDDGTIGNRRLTIIPGIEISADSGSKSKRLHIVGLFVNKSIYNLVDQYELNRKALVEVILKKLKQAKRYRVTYDDVLHFARDKASVGRFDIALTLYGMQYAPSVNAAYEEILMTTEMFVEREKYSPKEVIEAITAAKGIAILAHPNSCKFTSSVFPDLLAELKEYGLVGVEAYTSHITGEKREKLLMQCEQFGLIPVPASDFHSLSTQKPNIGIGIGNNMCIDNPVILRELKKARRKILHSEQGE